MPSPIVRDPNAEWRLENALARVQAGEKLSIALRGVTGRRFSGELVEPSMSRLRQQARGKGRGIACETLADGAIELGWAPRPGNGNPGGGQGGGPNATPRGER